MRHLVGERLADFLTELREDLHRNPELSFKEEATAERLEKALSDHAIEYRRVAGTGLLARIPGSSSSAPAVAIRGDIDALPVTEDTGLPYASENEGVMATPAGTTFTQPGLSGQLHFSKRTRPSATLL